MIWNSWPEKCTCPVVFADTAVTIPHLSLDWISLSFFMWWCVSDCFSHLCLAALGDHVWSSLFTNYVTHCFVVENLMVIAPDTIMSISNRKVFWMSQPARHFKSELFWCQILNFDSWDGNVYWVLLASASMHSSQFLGTYFLWIIIIHRYQFWHLHFQLFT